MSRAKTPAPTAAGSLKVPATGDGGSTGGYPWDVIGGVTLVLGSLIGAGSYAFWRRGRGRART